MNLNYINNFKSTYSLIIYKKISELYFNKYLKLGIDSFYNLFNYDRATEWRQLNNRIIPVLKKELEPIFKNFKIVKEYKNRKVKYIVFK